MKQAEFDEALFQMRLERDKRTAGLKKMIADLDVKIAQQGQLLHQVSQDYEKLRQERAVMNREKTRIEQEWFDRIKSFVGENQKDVTRQLEDMSEWALIKELRARGFSLSEGSTLTHPDKPEDFMQHLNAKLKQIEPCSETTEN